MVDACIRCGPALSQTPIQRISAAGDEGQTRKKVCEKRTLVSPANASAGRRPGHEFGKTGNGNYAR